MKKVPPWTIQLLPRNGVPRAYELGSREIAGIAAVAAVVLGSVTGVFVTGLQRHFSANELQRQGAENGQLISSLQAMEARRGQLSRELDEIALREQRFRVYAGLPLIGEEVYAVGVGGSGGRTSADGDLFDLAPELAERTGATTAGLDELLRRAELLGASLDEAGDSIAARQDRVHSLPSIWPVVGAASWLSSSFSYNRMHPLLGYRRPHTAVDISADYGSLVVATAAGRVTFAGKTNGSYGSMIDLQHGDGYQTRYAHLSRVAVRVGDEVMRGEVIGEVGDDGRTTGPHLHYEIKLNGRPQNPIQYFLDDNDRP